MTSNIERRLKRLEQHSEATASAVFVICASDDWPEDRLRAHFGILDKPGRELRVISQYILHPGTQPDGPLPPNVSPWDSGNWQRESLHSEPLLCGFGPAAGPQRPGAEWVREF